MKTYIQQLLELFSKSNYSSALKKDVQEWLVDSTNQEEKEKSLKQIWDETPIHNTEADDLKSLKQIYAKAESSQNKLQEFWRFSRKYAAITIVSIILFSTSYYLGKNNVTEEQMIECTSLEGEILEVELPDGSLVKMNENTLLLYPQSFKGSSRSVYLLGEANFKVKKDTKHPFIVHSSMLSVTALGTEFNVSTYTRSDKLKVTLIDGKICVNNKKEKSTYILSPNQQISYSKQQNKSKFIANINIKEITDWRREMIVFKERSFLEMIPKLERFFNVRIVGKKLDALPKDKLTLSFKKNIDFNQAIKMIREILGGFSYRIEKNICFIHLTKESV